LLQDPERSLGKIRERSDINLRNVAESVKLGSFWLSQKKQVFFARGAELTLFTLLPLLLNAIASNYIHSIAK
jgi:hypothetical protein